MGRMHVQLGSLLCAFGWLLLSLAFWGNANAATGYAESNVFVLDTREEHIGYGESNIFVLDTRTKTTYIAESNVFLLDTRHLAPSALSTLSPDPNPPVSVGMSGGTVYRHYRAVGANGLPAKASELRMTLDTEGGAFTPGVSLANGILEIGAEVDALGIEEGTSRTFTFPQTVIADGEEISLGSVPPAFRVKRVARTYTRTWDLFAGGSAGVTGTIGSAGVGVTVAAARLSVKGEGGMGLTVVKEYPDGIFTLSRRLEAGVAGGVQVPGVGIPVGKVKVGIGAEVMAKQLVRQTLRFDRNAPERARIGQAGFLLETFSLGGLALSPSAGLVLSAIVRTLNTLAGVDEILRAARYEEAFATGFEGSVGAGFGVEVGPTKLSFADASANIAFVSERATNFREDTRRGSFEVTTGVSLSALETGFKVFTGGALADLERTASIGQAMTFDRGGNPILYTMEVCSSTEAGLFAGRTIKNVTTGIAIDDGVLETLSADPGAGNLYALARGRPLRLGPSALVSDVRETMSAAADASRTLGVKAFDYTVEEEYGRGRELSLDISLEAALGVGAGVSLGVTGSFFDGTAFLSEEGVYIGGSGRLPLSSYSRDSYIEDSETLAQVSRELLSGVIPLIGEAIRNLWKKTKEVVQEGVDTVVETVTAAGEKVGSVVAKAGALAKGTTIELARYSPSTPRVVQEPSGKIAAKMLYVNDRVQHRVPGPRGKIVAEPVETVLVIVSDAFVVTVRDTAGYPVTRFDPPLELALNVLDEDLERSGFGPEDRDKVKIYTYDEATHSWIRIGGERDAEGGVRAQIERAGTYALGIETEVEQDTIPPRIEGLDPPDGGTTSPLPTIQVKVTDEEDGSGVALSSLKMRLDGEEVLASYDLETGMLSYTVEAPLQAGPHTVRITAGDNADNTADVAATFTVLSLAGDFNGDGQVSLGDFSLFVRTYGLSEGHKDFNLLYDLDGNGRIGLGDFSIFVRNYGKRIGSDKAMPVTVWENKEASLSMHIMDRSEEASGDVKLEMRLNGVRTLKGYSFKVRYDPEWFDFREAKRVSAGLPNDGNSPWPLLVVSSTPGEVIIADVVGGDALIEGGGVLVELCFKRKGSLEHTRFTATEGVFMDMDGEMHALGSVEVASLPQTFALFQNYPNPFNPFTQIRYRLPQASEVRMVIYDLLGREVRRLVEEHVEAGYHSAVWDGRDGLGQEVGSGVYLIRMEAKGFVGVRKMALIR